MEKKLTDNIVADFYSNIKYKKLSPRQEISYIKKSKLSFYDDVDDVHKAKYLDYYKEEFPKFGKQYEEALDKEELLNIAIENSKMWRDEFLENNQRIVYYIVKEFFLI